VFALLTFSSNPDRMESFQQLGAVLLVLGLLGAAVYGLRGKQLPGFSRELRLASDGKRPQKRLQVLERVALTAQHTLCLVRVGDRELIVTTAPGNCQVVPAPEHPQS